MSPEKKEPPVAQTHHRLTWPEPDASTHDGIHLEPGESRAELWHFDARLVDGTSLGIAFCLVGVDPESPDHYKTVVNVMLTTGDGDHTVHTMSGTTPASDVGTDRCDLRFGANHVRGDLETYELHVQSDDGSLALDLRYQALTEPWRPHGFGQVTLDEATHFADLILARCAITGTVRQDDVTTAVSGEGYHDHQWFDTDPTTTWHHWLLAHLYTDDATVVVYDLVAGDDHEFLRTPWIGIFDREGSLVFDNCAVATSSVETFVDDSSGKDYPQRMAYRNSTPTEEMTVTLEWARTLVAQDLYATASPSRRTELGGETRETYDERALHPTYARYLAEGSVHLTGPAGIVHGSGEAVCELNYPGRADPRAPLATHVPSGARRTGV